MAFMSAVSLKERSSSGARRRRVRQLAPVLVAAALTWPFLAASAERFLNIRADLAHADAIYVFAGSSAYLERAHCAAELFKQGRAPKIILSNDGQRNGWSEALQRNPFFTEAARAELERAGVPPERIEQLPQIVSSTYEEATLLRDYARAQNLRSILAVTSAYHSRRALWSLKTACRGTNIETGISAPTTKQSASPINATWWLSLRGWREIGGEYLKLIYYSLAHRA